MRKIILVTGGNRGIGLEICKELGKLGHTVLMGARDITTAGKLVQDLDGDIRVVRLDVSNDNDIKNVVTRISNEFGKLDVLVNNAAIIGRKDGALRVDMSEVKAVMETNLFGAWQLTQQMLPLLEESDEGRIINISSGKGSLASQTGDHSAYSLSKLALNGLTLMLNHELSDSVTVNSMCPGWVRTDMGGPNAHRSVEQGADTAVWLATADKIPNGKFLRDRKVIDW